MLNPSGQIPTESAGAPFISREEIRARLQDWRWVIVNVMPQETYRDGHIPNSINLPLGQIESRARAVLPDLAREIAVYCAGPT
jgi:ArsR family transcriptional regulator